MFPIREIFKNRNKILVKQQQGSFNVSTHHITFLSDFFSVYMFLETETLENQLEGGRHDHLQTQINVAVTEQKLGVKR